jgi:ribosomal protein L37AE/L43A
MKNEITYDLRDGTYEYREVADCENGTPAWLYHHLGLCFSLPERQYDAEEIVEEFRAEFGEQLEALRAGFEVVWDGHNHVGNWPGDTDEEAVAPREAEYDLRREVEEWEPRAGIEIWDASDYYHGGLTTDQIIRELKITADTTDWQLNKIEETAQAEARVDGRHLSKLSEFVKSLRAQMIESHTCVECGTRAPKCYDAEIEPSWDCSTCLAASSADED